MSINIKPSKKGTLHDAVGVDRDKKIPVSKLKINEGDSASLKKKKQFAINARKWNHGQDGISVPHNYQAADEEMFRNFQQNQNVSVEPFQGQYSDAMPIEPIHGYAQNAQYQVPQQEQPQPYRGKYGQAALAGLLAVDALIPNKKQPSQVSQPLISYNPNPYGTGSSALAQNGYAAAAPKFKRASYDEQQMSNNALQQGVKKGRETGFSPSDETLTADNTNNYLNPQQQFFYRALKNPNKDLTQVYQGFNDTLTGVSTASDVAMSGGNNPDAGLTYLKDPDKKLLQDEYLNYSKKYRGDGSAYFKDLQKRGAGDSRLNNLVPAASFALGQSYENGGRISNEGYKATSPDRWEPKLTIPSNQITMQGVNHPVYGEDNLGNGQMMYPGKEYKFPGDYVNETPIAQNGASVGDNESYKSWFKYNTREGKKGIKPNDPKLEYDYYTYWKDMRTGNNDAYYVDPTTDDHYIDRYKKPNHPSFSVESMYYTNPKEQPNVISWDGDFKQRVKDGSIKRMGGKVKKCKNGGTIDYQEGETYNLSEREIKELVSQGHQIKLV